MAKVTVSLLPETWQAFRIACIQRKLIASKEIERLIRAQLHTWQHEDKMLKPSQSPH